jgi:hypothetical protein
MVRGFPRRRLASSPSRRCYRPRWQCRLVNRNTEALRDADLDCADVVMTGGMLPQQLDTLAVECRSASYPLNVRR